MKLKHLLLSALAVASVAVSCKKDNGQNDKPSVSVEPASVTFEVGDMEPRIVTVTSNREWKIEDLKETWLEAEKLSDTDAKVSVKEQNTGKDRTATVTFRVAGQKASLTVTQKGEGGGSEPVVEGDGSKEKPYTATQALAITNALEKDACSDKEYYVKGIVSQIKEISASFGNATFWISDDGNYVKETNFYVFRAKDINGASIKDENRVKVGDVVVVYGKFQNYYGNTPQLSQGGQIVSVNGNGEVPEPTPDPTPSDAIFAESFSASQGDFTIDDKKLPEGATYVWTWTEQYGMKASAFIEGKSLASESWLISPEIDLTSVKEASLSFDHAANKFPAGKKVSDFVSVKVSKDGGSTWADLVIPTWPAGTSWSFVASGSADLAAYVGSKIKVAFVYTSNDGESGTWEVKNFVVEPKAGSSEPVEPTPDPEEPVGNAITLDIATIASSFTGTTIDESDAITVTSQGVTLSVIKTGNTAPVLPADAKNLLRFHLGNTMSVEVAGKKITGLVFTCPYADKCAAFTVSATNEKAVVNADAKTVTWSGAAVEKLVCTADAQSRISIIKIFTE